MKVYYLQNHEMGWDNVVSIAVSPMKCIEDYTDGEVILQTEAEVDAYLEEYDDLTIDYKTLKV